MRATTTTAGGGTTHQVLSATHTDTSPATLVAGDLLAANGSGALARVPIGTAGQVLTVTAGAPAWAAAGGAGASPGGASGDLQTNNGSGGFGAFAGTSCAAGQVVTGIGAGGALTCTTPAGGLVLLESHTASASATLDFTTRTAAGQSGATFQSDFDEYEIHLVDVVVGTNNATVQLNFSSNGGSTWNTTSNYYYAFTGVGNNGTGITYNTAGTNDTKFLFGSATNSLASRSMSATLTLTAIGSTVLDKVIGGLLRYSNQTVIVGGMFQGLFTVPGTAFNAFQVKTSAGTLASGTVRVYGVAK